jgi:hypothetical protein
MHLVEVYRNSEGKKNPTKGVRKVQKAFQVHKEKSGMGRIFGLRHPELVEGSLWSSR